MLWPLALPFTSFGEMYSNRLPNTLPRHCVLGALGIYGVFLIYAACFGTEVFFKRAMRWMDGFDLIGLVFIVAVGLVSIPLTMLLRLIYPRPS